MAAKREDQSKSEAAIESILAIACRFREHYLSLPTAGSGVDPNSHAAFGLAFNQLCASAKAVALILREGDESLFVTIPTLCRPAFEITTRLYWAWDNLDRWRLLSIHWIKEDLKQARELSSLEGTPKEPDVVSLLSGHLEHADPTGNLRKTLPSAAQILRDIQQHQLERHDTKLLLPESDRTYALTYRTMSQTAHGQLFATRSNPRDLATHGKVGLQIASIAMLAAFARWVATDDADLGRKREIADRVLCLAYDGEAFDIDRLKLVARERGSSRISDWSLAV